MELEAVIVAGAVVVAGIDDSGLSFSELIWMDQLGSVLGVVGACLIINVAGDWVSLLRWDRHSCPALP